MHLAAEGGVHHDPPVAELVAEPFDDQGAVVREVPGGLLLLADVGDEVVGRPVVETGGARSGSGRVVAHPPELAQERAEGAPQLGGPALGVAVPEGQLPGLPGSGRDEHAVVGDLLDPPGRGAEREHVADPRLVHHLLVELADPPACSTAGLVPAGEEDAEEATVGDGTAAGDREPLCARAPGESAAEPVPHQAGPELGELVAGIPAGQHVEHGLEHATPERREGRGTLHYALELVDRPRLHRHHRDDLLREDVEWVGGHPERLDPAVTHPFDHYRGLDEIAAVLGEEDPPGHGSDLVPRSADALQAAGDARRRLDLDDEVDRAHVDAELEARGGHDRGEAAGLELALDERPLLLAHGSVVGAREDGGRADRCACLSHQLGRDDLTGFGQLALVPLVPDLVQPRGEPLGEPARVREHERGVVRSDQVDHTLLDVWPDGRAAGAAGGVAREVEQVGLGAPGPRRASRDALAPGSTRVELRHVGHRDDDLQVEHLVRRRLHDAHGHVACTAEPSGHVLHGPYRRGQADPLRGLGQQSVEPFQRQREVRTSLRTGERVDLVENDRLHARQRRPRLRRQQEEERLRRGDQHVRRGARQRAPLVGGSVAGAKAHAHLGHRQAEPGRRLADAGQGCTKVALHVDGERLERGDVEDPAPLRCPRGRRGGRQAVEGPQESGQRLARPGGCDDQGVLASADGVPGSDLGGSRCVECLREPGPGGGGEAVQHRPGLRAGGGRRALGSHVRIVPPGTDTRASRRSRVGRGCPPCPAPNRARGRTWPGRVVRGGSVGRQVSAGLRRCGPQCPRRPRDFLMLAVVEVRVGCGKPWAGLSWGGGRWLGGDGK